MILKIILILFVFIPLFLSKRCNNSKDKKYLMFFSLFSLIVFSGFRELLFDSKIIGTDYEVYKNLFYSTTAITSFINIGYNVLIITLRALFRSHFSFFLVSSFIISYFTYIFARENVDDYDFGILVFITFGMLMPSYNIIRQWIACAIFLYSFKYIIKKKLLKYIICIIIASCFHISALLLFLIYPILNVKFSLKLKLIITVSLSLFIKLFFNSKIVFKIFTLIDSGYYYRYVVAIDKFNQVSNYTNFFFCFVILIIILFFYKKYSKIDNYNVYFNYLLLLVIVSFNATNDILFHRLLPYFLPALIVNVPLSYVIFDKKYKKYYYVFIASLLILCYLF